MLFSLLISFFCDTRVHMEHINELKHLLWIIITYVLHSTKMWHITYVLHSTKMWYITYVLHSTKMWYITYVLHSTKMWHITYVLHSTKMWYLTYVLHSTKMWHYTKWMTWIGNPSVQGWRRRRKEPVLVNTCNGDHAKIHGGYR